MSRILFIGPPYLCWGVQVIGTWPPLQLAYLAGVADQAGHEGRIYDAMNKTGATFDDVRAQVSSYRPDVVVSLDYLPVTGAISTATVPAALQALRVAKEVDPKIVTVIGGPHPTFMFREIFAEPLQPRRLRALRRDGGDLPRAAGGAALGRSVRRAGDRLPA